MSERCAQVEPLLSAWIDGALHGQEWAQVGRHLAACPRCRAELESLRVTTVLLRGAPLRTPPQQVCAALLDSRSIRGRSVGAFAPGSRHLIGRAALAVLSALGVIAGAAFAVGGQSDPAAPPVQVPLESFVADHLVRTTNLPVSNPGLFEVNP